MPIRRGLGVFVLGLSACAPAMGPASSPCENSVVVQASTEGPLARLSWLAGSWIVTLPDGEVAEEMWTVPSGGTMIGTARSVRNGVTLHYEHSRIEARGDQVVFIAQPKGNPETEFTLVSGDPKQATFENLAHDWPKRIRYERTNKGIAVRVDGAPGAMVQEWTYEPMVIARTR